MGKKNLFWKLIWTAARKDLLLGFPWLPIYSISEVILASSLAILLQLVFIVKKSVPIMDLIPGQLKYKLHINYIVDRGELILIVPLIIFIASLLKLLSSFMSTYLTERAGHKVAHRLREQMLLGFLSSSGNKLDEKNPDYVANQMMQDTTLLQGAISKGTISALRDAFVLIGIILAILLISWESFFIGLAVILPLAYVLKRISKRLNFYTVGGQKNQIEISTRLLLTHHGALTVNALRSHEREFQDFQNLNSKNYLFMKKSLFIRTFFSPTTEFLGLCMVAFIFEWKIFHLGNFHASGYSTMLILLIFSYKYIKNIANTITFFSEIQVVLKRVRDYIQDYTQENKAIFSSFLDANSNYVLNVDNISYILEDKREILSNCSLKVLKGQKIAFIGESGAGKTTLLRILAGLIIPSQGHISIIPEFLLAPQNPYIFRGTVQENIVYVSNQKSEGENNEKAKELILALSLAYSDVGANIFLDKQLGFLGEGLSGGEKARVSLARVMFSQPKLILLDEPTANLDAQSASLFWKCINLWKQKDSEHTVIAVSHALHEVQDFDYCFVFEQGKIIKSGKPSEMLSNV